MCPNFDLSAPDPYEARIQMAFCFDLKGRKKRKKCILESKSSFLLLVYLRSFLSRCTRCEGERREGSNTCLDMCLLLPSLGVVALAIERHLGWSSANKRSTAFKAGGPHPPGAACVYSPMTCRYDEHHFLSCLTLSLCLAKNG